MKSAWKLLRTLMAVLWLLSCLIVGPRSTVSAATTLNPTADATVKLTSPDSPDNGANLGVQGQFSGGTCNSTIEAYLKFDLSSIGNEITSATLTLRSTFASASGSLTMGVFGSTDDSWQESTVTWNTKPTLLSTTLSTASLTAAGSDVVFNNTQDFVDFLEGQRTGDGTATLGIMATACDAASVTQSMSSKEGSVAPKLDIDAPPTAVTLASFTATGDDAQVLVQWETASEINTAGFNLYRSRYSSGIEQGHLTSLNDGLIPGQALGSPSGASYSYTDTDIKPGMTYYYWLEDVEVTGSTHLHGPVSVMLPRSRPYLPLIMKR